MALIPIGPWLRDSTYRVRPLGLMDSTYRVPLLDSKLVRLRHTWYYCINALAALGMPQPSFWTLNRNRHNNDNNEEAKNWKMTFYSKSQVES